MELSCTGPGQRGQGQGGASTTAGTAVTACARAGPGAGAAGDAEGFRCWTPSDQRVSLALCQPWEVSRKAVSPVLLFVH